MYCRNCGNDVHEKAIACPKCGVDPRTEKNFCPSCGVGTNVNQIVCTSCGVSLEKASFKLDPAFLQEIDVNKLVADKSLLLAVVALTGTFFNWLKVDIEMIMTHTTEAVSLYGLASAPNLTRDSILVPFFLYLLPVALLGIIASTFIAQIASYRKLLFLAAIVVCGYVLLGLLLLKDKSSELGISGAFSIGIGLYITLIATLASAYFSGLFIGIAGMTRQGLDYSGPDFKQLLKGKGTLYAIGGLVVIGAIYSFYSYSRHLHRGEAKDLICAKYGLPSTEKKIVQHGLIRFSNYDVNTLDQLLKLSKQKVLSVEDKGQEDYYYRTFQIEITPEGKQYHVGDTVDGEGRTYYYLKAADKVFGEVTGIVESADGKSATVEYTWGYENINPVGEVYGFSKGEIKGSSQLLTSTAMFVKFDDGWRLETEKDLMENLFDRAGRYGRR